ncbi:IclR family transcriptional regulator [Corynebacterium sp.]|uniref:IclR family transcriptional regulator n=1 Tax=Corynebacterium sp. TaxID=1720 RepID=UPI003735E646
MIHIGPTHGLPPREYLQSVDLALVLILILRDSGRITISETAKLLDVSPSTVHRSVAMLVYRGFATRGENRTYLPGPALSSSSLQPGTGAQLVEATREQLIRLSEETGETCQLMTMSGNKCHILLSVAGATQPTVGSRRGQIIPAEQNAGGLAMLSEYSAGELRALYPTFPDATFDQLRRTLRRSRERGFAINNGLYEAHVSAVGACLRNELGDVLGAVAVTVPTHRFRSVHHPCTQSLKASIQTLNQSLAAVRPGAGA